MKNFWIISMLLLLGSNLLGQVKITGYAPNLNINKASLQLYPTELGHKGETTTTSIDNQGNFQFEVDIPIAIPCILHIADFQYLLFIFPNKSLELTINADKPTANSIVFKGETAKDNKAYLQYQNFLQQEKEKNSNNFSEKYQPKAYLQYQTILKNLREKYLAKLPSALDARLINWLNNDIQYQYANNLLTYPDRNFISRRPAKKYYRFLNKIKFNNESAILQVSYQQFLIAYTNYQLIKTQKWSSTNSFEEQLNLIRRYFFGNAYEFLHFFILKTYFKYASLEEIEIAYKNSLASNVDNSLKFLIREAHQAAKKTIIGESFSTYWLKDKRYQAPSPPRFGQGFPILEKGLLLYFWQPQQQISTAQKVVQLVKKVKGNDRINLVLVGTDLSYETWKETLKTSPLKSLSNLHHYWIDENDLNKAILRFRIAQFPCLLFLNQSNQLLAKVDWDYQDEIVDWLIDFTSRNYSNVLEEPISFLYYQPFSVLSNYQLITL